MPQTKVLEFQLIAAPFINLVNLGQGIAAALNCSVAPGCTVFVTTTTRRSLQALGSPSPSLPPLLAALQASTLPPVQSTNPPRRLLQIMPPSPPSSPPPPLPPPPLPQVYAVRVILNWAGIYEKMINLVQGLPSSPIEISYGSNVSLALSSLVLSVTPAHLIGVTISVTSPSLPPALPPRSPPPPPTFWNDDHGGGPTVLALGLFIVSACTYLYVRWQRQREAAALKAKILGAGATADAIVAAWEAAEQRRRVAAEAEARRQRDLEEREKSAREAAEQQRRAAAEAEVKRQRDFEERERRAREAREAAHAALVAKVVVEWSNLKFHNQVAPGGCDGSGGIGAVWEASIDYMAVDGNASASKVVGVKALDVAGSGDPTSPVPAAVARGGAALLRMVQSWLPSPVPLPSPYSSLQIQSATPRPSRGSRPVDAYTDMLAARVLCEDVVSRQSHEALVEMGLALYVLSPSERTHPHVLPTLGLGTNGVRSYAFLTPRCPTSLQQLLHQAEQTLSLRLKLISEWNNMACSIADGLTFLHGQQIAHAALHPGNVLLDAQMRPLLADYGPSMCELRAAHARATAAAEAEYPWIVSFVVRIVTQRGKATAAPEPLHSSEPNLYLSPEILPSVGTVHLWSAWRATDIPSDLWALGCLLARLATLKPLYYKERQSMLAHVPADMRAAAARDSISSGAWRPAAQLEGEKFLPLALWELVEQCTALEPMKRPSSAQALAALEHMREEEGEGDSDRLEPPVPVDPHADATDGLAAAATDELQHVRPEVTVGGQDREPQVAVHSCCNSSDATATSPSSVLNDPGRGVFSTGRLSLRLFEGESPTLDQTERGVGEESAVTAPAALTPGVRAEVSTERLSMLDSLTRASPLWAAVLGDSPQSRTIVAPAPTDTTGSAASVGNTLPFSPSTSEHHARRKLSLSSPSLLWPSLVASPSEASPEKELAVWPSLVASPSMPSPEKTSAAAPLRSGASTERKFTERSKSWGGNWAARARAAAENEQAAKEAAEAAEARMRELSAELKAATATVAELRAAAVEAEPSSDRLRRTSAWAKRESEMAQQLAAAEARASDAEAAASAARAAAEAAERQQALAAEASEKAAGVAAADEEKPVMLVAPPAAAGVDIAGALVRAFDADGDGKLTFGDVRTIFDKTLGGLFAPVLAPKPEPVPISKALTSLTSLSPIASVSDEPALPTVFAAARISFALFEWEKTDFDQLERRVIEGQNLQNPTSLKAVIAAARVRKVFAAARSSSARFVWDESDFNQLERSVYQALGMPAPAPPVAGWFAREVKPSPKTVRGQLSQRLFGGSPEKATVRAAMLDSVAEEEAPAAVEEEHAPEESAESADAVQLVAASITDVSSCTGGVDSMSATALVEAAPATTAFAPATEPPAVGTATRPSTALVVASYASAALTAATAGSFRGLRQTPRVLILPRALSDAAGSAPAPASAPPQQDATPRTQQLQQQTEEGERGRQVQATWLRRAPALERMSEDEGEGEVDELEPHLPIKVHTDTSFATSASATSASARNLAPSVELALQGSLDPKTEQWAHASTQQLERQQNVSPRMKRMQQLAEMRERGRELQATRLRSMASADVAMRQRDLLSSQHKLASRQLTRAAASPAPATPQGPLFRGHRKKPWALSDGAGAADTPATSCSAPESSSFQDQLQPTLEWVPELERLQEEKGEGERDALKLPAPDLFDAFGQLSQRLFGGSPEKATVRAAMLDSVAEEEAPAAVEEEHAPEESAESADAVQLVAASITDVSSCTGGVDSMSATALVEAAPTTTAFAPATELPSVGTATRPSTALVVASYASAALTAATASFRGLRQTPRALEGKSARGSSFQVQVRLQPTLERMSVDEDEGESDMLEPPVPVDPNADATDGIVAEATDSSQQERPDVLLALSERTLTPVAALDVFGQLSQRLFGGVNFGSPENATAPLERGSVSPRRGAGMAKLVSQTKAFQVAAAIKLQSMARGRAARRLAFLKRQSSSRTELLATQNRPDLIEGPGRQIGRGSTRPSVPSATRGPPSATRAKRIEPADGTWNPESPIATIRGLDPVAMIRQLKQLLDDGLITQEQFEAKRLEAKEQLRRAYKEGKIRV
jgi:serine/threonine protein kinase